MRQSLDYPVLRKPRLVSGIGFRTALLLWCGAGAGGVTVGMPFGMIFVVIAAAVHLSLSWFFKIDPRLFENYAAYATMPDEYRSGLPCLGEIASSRPAGFGQGCAL